MPALSIVENGGRKGTGGNLDIVDEHNSTQLATVSDLPGLLLLVVLAVHSAVDQFEEEGLRAI